MTSMKFDRMADKDKRQYEDDLILYGTAFIHVEEGKDPVCIPASEVFVQVRETGLNIKPWEKYVDGIRLKNVPKTRG